MDPILEIAKKHNLAVVEDAAQAIGSEYNGRRAGSMATIGCFSFFPSKNLGAFGDGGAVVTNDEQLAETIRAMRGHGAKPKYYHQVVGGNFRLDAIHAAVLRVKLRYLDDWTSARQRNAAFYDIAFSRAGLLGGLIETPVVRHNRHIFNQYIVRLRERDAVRDHLKQQQVATEIYYPRPMHLQECFGYLGHQPG